ncbi:hypothetical protein Vadar_013446 [Vaccinium darrowii]|uniref:Uncharacterized protein n=1 Tax=Vaccinium darrowii TaxID=229202 RepID=A0ACB7YW69_9ERIC|nr:hypothetical protein Vadar_013446 [Vaccinium darrowii]
MGMVSVSIIFLVTPQISPNPLLPGYKHVISFRSFDTREGNQPGKDLGKFLELCISRWYFLSLHVLDLERVFRHELPEALGELILLRALHPPTTPLKVFSTTYSPSSTTIDDRNVPQFVEAAAFIKQADNEDFNRIHKQNNYTNLHLGTIANQLTRIEEHVNQINEKSIDQLVDKTDDKKEIQKTNMKPPMEIEGFKLSNPEEHSKLLSELDKRIKNMSINALSEEIESEGITSDTDTPIIQKMSLNPVNYFAVDFDFLFPLDLYLNRDIRK